MPFRDKALPGWFHLPLAYDGEVFRRTGRFRVWTASRKPPSPCTATGGCSGVAVLTLEGPGHYGSAVNGIHLNMPNWIEAGHAVMEWLRSRTEVDPDRIGVVGHSMGSFFGTIVAATEPPSGRARSLTAPERALYSRHAAAPVRSISFGDMNEPRGI